MAIINCYVSSPEGRCFACLETACCSCSASKSGDFQITPKKLCHLDLEILMFIQIQHHPNSLNHDLLLSCRMCGGQHLGHPPCEDMASCRGSRGGSGSAYSAFRCWEVVWSTYFSPSAALGKPQWGCSATEESLAVNSMPETIPDRGSNHGLLNIVSYTPIWDDVKCPQMVG